MFEYIYSNFDMPGWFRLFGFISFRAMMAGLSAMFLSFLFGEVIIRELRKLNFQEIIRSDGPDSHAAKAGTPTMGGLMILFSMTVSCIFFGNFSNIHFVLILFCTIALGAIGFRDDYTKVVHKNKKGMSSRTKMALTLLVAIVFSVFYYLFTPGSDGGTHIIRLTSGEVRIPIVKFDNTGLFIPFLKEQLLDLSVFVAIPFWMLVIVGTVHAVNLTDGLDGLAIGVIVTVAITLGVLAYITGTLRWAYYLSLPGIRGAHEITVFLSALTGAGIGFLWYNAHPAMIFMGDTGSLSLGGALGMAAVILKKEFFLLIAGGIFVAEALSVILQVGSFKLRGKRIFKMAPLHHHFELKGWPETRVVTRFWLIGVILCLIALSTIRLQ